MQNLAQTLEKIVGMWYNITYNIADKELFSFMYENYEINIRKNDKRRNCNGK